MTTEQFGDIHLAREQYQAAIATYAKVEPPSSAVWNKMGIAYQMLLDLKDAARCYNESLNLEPNDAQALNNLATVEDLQEDFRPAESNYRKALELEPHSAVFLKNLGTNLLMQHEIRKGEEAYAEALRLNPHIFDGPVGPWIKLPAPARDYGAPSYLKALSCARAGLDNCAIEQLRKAFNEGFATVKKVEKEKSLKKLEDSPELQRLLAEQK
jgi:tetratricopeptide (TPR) repeat protein